jgi:hypothetical protein
MQDTSWKSYDRTILRAYAPDYLPRKEYDRMLSASPIRRAVLNAVGMTTKGPQEIPPIPLDFPGDDAAMTRVMSNGQAVMAKIQYFVEPPLKELLQVEKERDKEQSRRWRVEYDLLLGRLLAARVRTYTYNAICAEMKRKKRPFQRPDSNMWSLRPDASIPDGIEKAARVQEHAEKARELLRRVVDENAGTPWAEFAQRELQTELGFKWVESYRPPPPVASNRPATPAKTAQAPAKAPPAAATPPVPKKI